ncbi:VacJ family lipoprotein [Sinimarinibacterium sp. NLF-5-8]|uniref:MlaA family lipoprotein n=1 Tax=Sinimarinibacterium sp. NLF-5-8 TaxID=2698684 RepID=UPI00137C338D|nr:VacJ family lipoprotein [Sinimarinibacterium sp. NLF-5-8]QHS10528.1 VacJ family lipoprotein [Sinimarinibacterium sp. NLF-5-8]
MRSHSFTAARLAALLALPLLSACAHNSVYEPQDPLEKINRPIFKFNMTADRYILRPVAKGYAAVVPSPARTGIDNFFNNLFYPRVIIHDLLQGKFAQAGRDTVRLVVNTTFGIGGLFDPATYGGLEHHDEDLGQTLGYWGVGDGWYLMLPFFGPSTNRDLIGSIGDNWTDVMQYIDDITWAERIGIKALQVVDERSRLLDLDSIIDQQFDPYIFIRTAYLQNRLNKVYDGNPPLALMEPELPDFDDDDE